MHTVWFALASAFSALVVAGGWSLWRAHRPAPSTDRHDGPSAAGTILAARGPRGTLRYTVTQRDELWMLRAVEGEGRLRVEVAQTLVNRFMYLAARRPGLYPTMQGLVRAYAQPVNPIWAPGGKRYEAALRRARSKRARARILKRGRKRLKHLRRRSFSDATRHAVHRALTRGLRDVPKTAVHYAAPGVGRNKGLVKLKGGSKRNWLWASHGSRGWRGYEVAVAQVGPQPAPRTEPAPVGAGLWLWLLTQACLLMLFLLLRGRRTSRPAARHWDVSGSSTARSGW